MLRCPAVNPGFDCTCEMLRRPAVDRFTADLIERRDERHAENDEHRVAIVEAIKEVVIALAFDPGDALDRIL